MSIDAVARGLASKAFTRSLKSNMAASRAPTITDDAAAGYSAGSRWMWASTGQVWNCRAATAGAAAWELMDAADHPGYISGNWYYPVGITLATGNSLAGGTVRFTPFIIKSRVTITQIGVRINTAASGGNVQAAVYSHNSAIGRPTGPPIAVTPSLSTTGAGNMAVAPVGGDFTLEPGLYWFGINADNSTVGMQAVSNGQSWTTALIGSATEANVSNTGTITGLSVQTAMTFGTWSDVTSASWSETSALGAILHFKVA